MILLKVLVEFGGWLVVIALFTTGVVAAVRWLYKAQLAKIAVRDEKPLPEEYWKE